MPVGVPPTHQKSLGVEGRSWDTGVRFWGTEYSYPWFLAIITSNDLLDLLQGEFKERILCEREKKTVCEYVMLYKSNVFSGQCCYFPICFSFSMFRLNFHEMYKIPRVGCMIFPCLGLECSDALAQPCSCDKWEIRLTCFTCNFIPIFLYLQKMLLWEKPVLKSGKLIWGISIVHFACSAIG